MIEQAEALGEPLDDPLLLFSALYGHWVANVVAFNGDLQLDLAGIPGSCGTAKTNVDDAADDWPSYNGHFAVLHWKPHRRPSSPQQGTSALQAGTSIARWRRNLDKTTGSRCCVSALRCCGRLGIPRLRLQMPAKQARMPARSVGGNPDVCAKPHKQLISLVRKLHDRGLTFGRTLHFIGQKKCHLVERYCAYTARYVACPYRQANGRDLALGSGLSTAHTVEQFPRELFAPFSYGARRT